MPGRTGQTRWGERAADLLVVGLPLGALYLRTVSRDLGTIDSGELAAVCARLEIAHPTGYPLYTLLGRLAVMLLPATPIAAVNLLSAAAGLAASLLAVSAARVLLRSLGSPSALSPETRSGEPSVWGSPLHWCSWAAGLWLGTNRIFWEQSTGNEVYSLHLVFVVLLVGYALILLKPGAGPRDFLVLSWIAGLSVSNHLTVVFLAPAVAVAAALWIGRGTRIRLPLREAPVPRAALLVPGLLLFLLACSVDLYLPIRSSLHPGLDWGAPTTWTRFQRHVLAEQYRVWLFESGAIWATNLTNWLKALPSRLSWPLLVLALVGFATLTRRRRDAVLVLTLVLVVTVAWAASYDIHDLAPYFLPADLVLVLAACCGAFALVNSWYQRGRVEAPGRLRPLVSAGVLFVVTAFQAGAHFPEVDRHDDHFIRAHATAFLAGVPPEAIVITRHWDGLVSPVLYLQEVEGVRRDVTFVDTELLRRSWYFPQLRRRDPGLFVPIEDRLRTYLAQLDLFENHRPYDPQTIEGSYRALLQGLAGAHRPKRPTLITPDIEPIDLRTAGPVPEGLAFRFLEDPSASPPLPPPDPARLAAAGFRPSDETHRQVLGIWEHMLRARIRFLTDLGRSGEVPAWAAAEAEVRRMRATAPGDGAP